MMIIFWVMLKVLVFALCLGAGLAVLIFVPLTIYAIPYCLWVGGQNCIGKQKDKKMRVCVGLYEMQPYSIKQSCPGRSRSFKIGSFFILKTLLRLPVPRGSAQAPGCNAPLPHNR